jgi:preprotein translocase subunit SecY
MSGMIETLKNAFKIPDLRKKLLFTLIMLIVYRIGIRVPVPGIDAAAFTELLDRFGQLGSFLDIISGGAFKQVSIFSLGIVPYINSSIIMQLLTVAIPALERLQKEGDEGRKKIQQYVRYLTVGLAVMQARRTGTRRAWLRHPALPFGLNAILVILSFTAGTAFIMWIGEQINESGIGNGISLIIFAGIVTRGPDAVKTLFGYFQTWTLTRNAIVSIVMTIGVIALFVLVIALVVFVQMAERRIRCSTPRRSSAAKCTAVRAPTCRSKSTRPRYPGHLRQLDRHAAIDIGVVVYTAGRRGRTSRPVDHELLEQPPFTMSYTA